LHKTSVRCVENRCLNKLFEFFLIFGRITTYNFMQINTITPNDVYCKIVQLKLRYRYSITLISHKTKVRYVKNWCLNKLFGFMKIFGRITAYNLVQINIITPNYLYYKIVQLKLRYEYSITLILHITKVRYAKSCCLNKLFGFMKVFGRKTTHNLVQINIITPNYAYYKIVQLTLQNEYFRALFLLKT
jgi:transposase-like protein